MREIKFRAWNKVFKKMFPVVNLYLEGTDAGIEMGDEEKGQITVVAFAHLDLMQYTGLKDKNGKEIYEGDVVKYIDASNTVNHLIVKWNESNACFDIGWVRTDFASNCGEVIGNIYENSELLEAAK